MHVPLVQLSFTVQARPSLQDVPSGLNGLLHTPVVVLQVPMFVHGPHWVHTTAVPLQEPAVHTSFFVHARASLQLVPFVLAGLLHVPLVHVPALWHWSLAVHTTAVPLHAPLVHLSLVVHALPSLQLVPLVLVGLLHVPLLQVPALWHWSLAVHTTAVPAHAPLVHLSLVVQAMPSSQAVASALLGSLHTPVVVSQVPPAWH